MNGLPVVVVELDGELRDKAAHLGDLCLKGESLPGPTTTASRRHRAGPTASGNASWDADAAAAAAGLTMPSHRLGAA